MLEAGKYTKRIRLQPPPTAQDTYGDTAPAEQDTSAGAEDLTRWASVESQPGREFVAAGQEHADTSHWIEMRYLGTVTQAWRVLYRGRLLDIQAATHDESSRRWTRLWCKERR